MLFSTRYTKMAESIDEDARNLSKPRELLLRYLDILYLSYCKERYEIKRYSPSTGKPVEYQWKPFCKWDGKLWIGTRLQGLYLENDNPIVEKILQLLDAGAIFLENELGRASVRLIPRNDVGNGVISSHIEFVRLN